jgi:hypothetical protein
MVTLKAVRGRVQCRAEKQRSRDWGWWHRPSSHSDPTRGAAGARMCRPPPRQARRPRPLALFVACQLGQCPHAVKLRRPRTESLPIRRGGWNLELARPAGSTRMYATGVGSSRWVGWDAVRSSAETRIARVDSIHRRPAPA